MTLTRLPVELILMIGNLLMENDLFHLLQVSRRLLLLLLLKLYRRHVQESQHQEGFFWCIATGIEVSVQRFLSCGADANLAIEEVPFRLAKIPIKPWLRVQTPLSIASHDGSKTLVMLLLSHGAHVDGFRVTGPNNIVQTAVLDVLLSGHDRIVRRLLKHGLLPPGPNIDFSGLLNRAINNGNLSMLKELVDFGADFHMPFDGNYHLAQVASLSHLSIEILQFLLDNEAQIGLADHPPGRLVDLAVRHGTIDTLRLLLTRGAECWPGIFPSVVTYCTSETVHPLLAHGCTPDIDILMRAVEAARGENLQVLVDNCVDLNVFDTRTGSTALYRPPGFMKRGARVGSRPCWPTRVPTVPLTHLPRPLPDTLMRKAHLPPWQDSNLFYDSRIEKSHPEEIVRCLVRGGADLNALDTQGRTPFVLAGEICPAVQQFLIKIGGYSSLI